MKEFFEVIENVYNTSSVMDKNNKAEALNLILNAYRDYAREKILSTTMKGVKEE